jgi:hypothetical protein
MRRFTGLSLLVFLTVAPVAGAAVLYSDGFESYTAGGNPLDKNVAGPNSAPNGSGNPWFGPNPPNARVVGTDSINGPAVSPHSGNNMIRGLGVQDGDQNWYNLAYRQNGGNSFTGDIQFDWWFYDPTGQSADSTKFRDYAAIGYYNTTPGGTDYPGTGSLNTGATQIQRLSLGAQNGNAASQTVYEARVVGDTGGNAGLGATWFLTGVARSVGWHKGTIKVGPAQGDNTNTVDFYVDDIFAIERNSHWTLGYNVLEFNTSTGPTTGYFDDATFSSVPEPASVLLLISGGLAMLWSRRRAR